MNEGPDPARRRGRPVAPNPPPPPAGAHVRGLRLKAARPDRDEGPQDRAAVEVRTPSDWIASRVPLRFPGVGRVFSSAHVEGISMRWNVEGADTNTGRDRVIQVEADSAEQAERRATRQGLLVSAVFPSFVKTAAEELDE